MIELSESQILEEIVKTYTAGRLGYRDAMLRVGKLIGDYVRAVLMSSVGMNIQDRIDSGKTRASATLNVSKVLGISLSKVSGMVRCYQAATVLSGGSGDVGGLSYSAIRSFAVCVRRRVVQSSVRSRASATEEALAAAETWDVRIGYGWAVGLFAQARTEGWTDVEVRRRLKEAGRACRVRTKSVGTSASVPSGRTVTAREVAEIVARRTMPTTMPDLVGVVRNGSPRDAAEAIAQLVRESSDPGALSRHLIDELSGGVLV